MPQLKSTLATAFVAELRAAGVEVTECEVPAGELRQSQLEIHEDNVVALMSNPEQLRKPLFCSQDGYVLDGHHRWAANKRLNNTQVVYLVKLPGEEALARMAEFASRHSVLCEAKK